MTIFNAGIPNSFSVYVLRFFFSTGPPVDFNGGALLFGGFLCFETPSPCGLVLFLLFRMPDLFAACFGFTVEVREGAIVLCLRNCERNVGQGIILEKSHFWDAGGRSRVAE